MKLCISSEHTGKGLENIRQKQNDETQYVYEDKIVIINCKFSFYLRFLKNKKKTIYNVCIQRLKNKVIF